MIRTENYKKNKGNWPLKHENICSIIYFCGNINQAIMRFHLTPVTMDCIKNKHWLECGEKAAHTLWGCKTTTMRNNHGGLETVERKAPDHGGIPLLQTDVAEMESDYKASPRLPKH